MTEKISEFQGQYRFLSNFWSASLIVIPYQGVNYPSVEHAFQAAKCNKADYRILPNGDKVLVSELIRRAYSPGQAKRLGRGAILRSDWEGRKVDVMLDLLRIKFTNPELRSMLLATGDAVLEEGNRWKDNFWGVSPPNSGNGKNTLGRLLMQVREEILNESH